MGVENLTHKTIRQDKKSQSKDLLTVVLTDLKQVCVAEDSQLSQSRGWLLSAKCVASSPLLPFSISQLTISVSLLRQCHGTRLMLFGYYFLNKSISKLFSLVVSPACCARRSISLLHSTEKLPQAPRIMRSRILTVTSPKERVTQVRFRLE